MEIIKEMITMEEIICRHNRVKIIVREDRYGYAGYAECAECGVQLEVVEINGMEV